MSMVEGGLRDRLVAHSVHELVRAVLEDLGWFDAGRQHLPVTLIDRDPGDDPQEIPAFNTVAVFDEDVSGVGYELGSTASEDAITFYADVYAANDSIGRSLSGDLRAALEGKMAAIGRVAPVLTVQDYRQSPPTPLFSCEIVDVLRDRGHDETRGWRRHWWTVRFTVVDAR